MQTSLAQGIRDTPAGREAAAVIGKCVHCGFCLATCPTYRVLGDELDSPRGRIYLMKQVLEGKPATATTQRHLDRCLTCRACETTCPSGVEYHALLDTGRAAVEAQVGRPPRERLLRAALRAVTRRRRLFSLLAALGRVFSVALPASLRRQLIPPSSSSQRKLGSMDSGFRRNDRVARVLLLQGCVQPGLRPNINASATRVLARAGVETIEVPAAGCCGALRFHLGAHADGLDDMRALIDAWWPQVEAGVEAIVITASGCGAQVRDYGRLLRHDPAYAERAARVSALARDLAEVVEAHSGTLLASAPAPSTTKVAFQSPCTLQHGQRVTGAVELLLKAAGYELVPVRDGHLCCGSAGTYSITQPELSRRLRADKLAALEAGRPDVIVSANIGCITHLAAGTERPVRHWIELLDERLGP
ncbi:MAG TPA: glycolate oxidase subunit GlcF [Verrucomicrobiae bacterium]|nr:glycolate oxidase subunit GlcF [Verrucomicrobiae bacterium]